MLQIYLFCNIKRVFAFINVANTFISLYQMTLVCIKTMEGSWVSCKKNNANKNSSVKRKNQARLIIVSNYTFCGKKVKFY